jgi:predicted transcriptional regulator
MMYQLVFKGECVSGVDENGARQQAKALFKASDAQVGKMFSSARVVIRNNLDGQTAQKYQAALKKNGMIAYIEPMPSAETSETGESRASEAGAADTGTDTTPPARAGTAASSERGEAGSVEQEPGDRLPVAGEKVDTILAGSGLSLGKPGEQLGVINEEAPPVFEHLDDWTVAPPGEDLVENDEKPEPPAPDISHLSLADEPSEGRS